MLTFEIPGYDEPFNISDVILDYNGTLATDGKLLCGTGKMLKHLSEKVKIHILTSDTFGTAERELKDIPCVIILLEGSGAAEAKLNYLRGVGIKNTICIGNGNNDRQMLAEAAIGIAVIQKEGATNHALLAADIICNSIEDALELMLNPKRIIATLRT